MAPRAPDPQVHAAMLLLAVRQAQELPALEPGETAVGRMRARVGSAHRRLVATYGRHGRGPTPKDDAALLAERALDLATAAVRGLQDGLATGELEGYEALDEDRLAQQIERVTGAPRPDAIDTPRFDPVVDGWTLALGRHVAALLREDAGNEPVVREAFAAVGAATALSASLTRRPRR